MYVFIVYIVVSEEKGSISLVSARPTLSIHAFPSLGQAHGVSWPTLSIQITTIVSSPSDHHRHIIIATIIITITSMPLSPPSCSSPP